MNRFSNVLHEKWQLIKGGEVGCVPVGGDDSIVMWVQRKEKLICGLACVYLRRTIWWLWRLTSEGEGGLHLEEETSCLSKKSAQLGKDIGKHLL